MAFLRLTTQDCLDWLRQKTRTASSPAAANGEWTDAVIVKQLNAAVREIVTRMLNMPWAPYFIATEVDQTTTAGLWVVGSSLSPTKKYSAIKVAWIQYGTTEVDVGKFLPVVSVNRLIYTASYQARSGSKTMGDAIFAIVRSVGHELADPGILIQLFNTLGVEKKITVYFYCYPDDLTGSSPATENVGLPSIARNALLSYTLMLMTEDERNVELHEWAQGRFQAEMQALSLASPTSLDMPDGLLGPAEGATS